MSEINHDNVLIQVRDALQRNAIKLWLEPYSVAGEPNDQEITVSFQIYNSSFHHECALTFLCLMNLESRKSRKPTN